MKYYKLINDMGYETPKLGQIYQEDDTLDTMFNSIGYHATNHPDLHVRTQWKEVSEREYWQQELDAGKFVKGDYYNFNDLVIWKFDHDNVGEYFVTPHGLRRNGGNFNKPYLHKLATQDEIEYLECCNKKDKFVTKEEFMKSKEFKLPERWCVKSIGENKYKDLENYLEGVKYSPSFWDGTDYYYHFDKYGCFANKIKDDDYTEITFEQFQQYVLKEEQMDKKIIGYKLIKPEYEKATLNILNCNWGEPKYLVNAPSCIKILEEAEVLDLWFEKVYEPEFKVGDWVTYYNKTSKIKEWTPHAYCIMENGDEPFKHLLKKAIEEEIEEALKSKFPDITINGYKAEFFETYVKFGCAEISKEVFEDLYTMKEYKNTNREIESVTIGKGTFSKEQIKQIAEYYKNK